MPADDPDPERARQLCATACRDLLGALSPVLILLCRTDRERTRALVAYTRTLFDFALERGMHGERLARINRWEFLLDESLEGESPGQPVFVAMAGTHTRSPWNREALDAIAGAARRAAIDEAYALADPVLVAHFLEALTDVRPGPDLTRLGVRLVSLLSGSRTISASERARSRPDRRESLGEALGRLDLSMLSDSWRRCLTFLAIAGDDLAGQGPDAKASLGVFARMLLLARARLAW
jgi:hypothetical protein